MVKPTAVAHPIQGLVKYHGLQDERLRLPFHDSISVCTAPLTSRTTIEFGGVPPGAAAGLRPSLQEVSAIARRGAGSATRSVTGGFSKWRRGGTDAESYAEQLAGPELRMGIVVALVPAYKQTEDAHREVLTSPFFHARLAEVPRLLLEMELAIRERSVPRIGEVAERDTLMLQD